MRIFCQSRLLRFLFVLVLTIATISLIVAMAVSAPKKASVTTEVGLGQCRPCHLNIERTKVNGLKFSHGAHFEKNVKCDGCHSEFPHFRDKVERVEMDTCFNCHGMKHGNVELASGKCSLCHEKSFNLRPFSHGIEVMMPRKPATTSAARKASDWEKKGHINSAKKEISNCYMCHKAQYCFDCHKARSVVQSDVYYKAREQMRSKLKGGLKSKPGSFSKEVLDQIKSGAPVRSSFCFPCHSSKSMNSAQVIGLIYNHEAHFEEGIRCMACHQEFPHKDDKTSFVSEEVCHYCHGVQHGTKILAPRNCLLCHPSGYKLSHDQLSPELRNDWQARHNKVYRQGNINCYRCHTNDDCIKCHLSRNVRPLTHRKFSWALQHGERPSKELKTCGVCHSPKWCQSCHKTPMPHPPLWFRDHRAPAPRQRDCYICHEKKMCQDCHHESGLKLNRSTCKKCHEALDTATLLTPSLKFTHESHFARKVVCTKCHSGRKPGKEESFTMESCYLKDCHGFNAKAPAACMFCHPTQFDLVPKNHKLVRWGTKIHSRTALKNKRSCELCHPEKFCIDCHGAPMPHPPGFKDTHGRWARRNISSCLRCHRKLSNCKSCHHKEWTPGTDWKKQHPSIVKENGASECFECHNPAECAKCHLTGRSKYGF